MKKYQIPPYGHAYCPNCKSQFLLQTGTLGFGVRGNGSDYLLCVLCGPCNLKFEDCTPDQKRLMASECNETVLASEGQREESPFWSLTTAVTLALNGGDLVSAFEKGHGLSDEEYQSICARNDISIFKIGGITLLLSNDEPGGRDV